MTLSLGVLLISIITQGSPILTTMASATTSATQEPTSSAANRTGEDDIQTGDIDLLSCNTKANNSWNSIKS